MLEPRRRPHVKAKRKLNAKESQTDNAWADLSRSFGVRPQRGRATDLRPPTSDLRPPTSDLRPSTFDFSQQLPVWEIACKESAVWEMIHSSGILGGVATGVAWLVTVCLLIAGLIGCVLPVLPGHLIIFIAAIAHRIMLGDTSGLQWWSFVVLGLMMAISQAFETFSGAAGSKWFGGTRWGAVGAVIGSIVGLFFLPFGLLLGPLIGAFGFEIAFARKHPKPAMISGVGSVVGTVVGMGFKIVVGLGMVAWFFIDVFLIGK